MFATERHFSLIIARLFLIQRSFDTRVSSCVFRIINSLWIR